MSDTNKPAEQPPFVGAAGSADSPWPARSIVAKLVEAADLLFDHCNYDRDGWESIHIAREHARNWLGSQIPLHAPVWIDLETGEIVPSPNIALNDSLSSYPSITPGREPKP